MRIPAKVIAWAVAASAAVAVPLIAGWEGLRTDPYYDIAGVASVCYGETRVPMRQYSASECDLLIREATEGFARAVLACTPGLAHHPYQLAAATSLAYNIGARAYCASTVAQKFNKGDLRGGCEAFALWRMAGGKVEGLVNRRAAEMELCFMGLDYAAAA